MVNGKMKNKRSAKSQSIIRMTLLLGILIFVNVIAQFAFERIDMTQEKRYSLSNSSKDLAKGLEDIVYFRIYLDGDLPPGFLKLKNSLKEMLDEFRIYSNDNIEYEFIDPSANPDEKQRVELYKQLSQKGLFPTNLEENESNEKIDQLKELRTDVEIYNMLDLYYRFHWYCVDERIKGVEAKISEGIIYERRKALEWLINKDSDWYDIEMGT